MWRRLARLESEWNRQATTDPLWAILTDPRMKNRQWDPRAFFETGRHEIEGLMSYAGSLGVELRHRCALDFGCGVGRLTRPLAGYFEEVWGVDISPAMLELARDYNADIPNCTFVQIRDPSLHPIPGSFDLIYSSITLQHMPPRLIKHYLRALATRVRPGGLLIFQLAERSRLGLADRVISFLYESYGRLVRREPVMDMHALRMPRVICLLESSGCRVLGVTPNDAAGPEWTSFRYTAVREDVT